MKRLAIAFGCITLLGLVDQSFAQDKKATGVVVDKEKKLVTVDAKVAPRKLEHLKGEVYPIELIASWGHPKGKKAHETVLTIDVYPSEVHKGLEQLGLKPGKPAKGSAMKEGDPDPKGEGPPVNVYIEVPDGAGGTKRLTLDKVLMDPKTKKAPPKLSFAFTGSTLTAPDPNKPDDKKYGADLTGSLICLFPVTDEVVLQTAWTMKEEKFLKLEVRPDVLPKEGSPVKLVIEAAGK
ncbi:MAG: YdjY domain-containing protein [Gemmataceae bacterium]|nr:YdjY domain-containing protein [Gemmataceae bacterium]